MKANVNSRFLYLPFAFAAVLLVIFGYNAFPVPCTDSIVFLITADRYAKGFGLTNPFYYVTNLVDPTHTGKFDYYPPLFPLFVGFVAKINPVVRTIFLVCSGLGIFNILFLTTGLKRIYNNGLSRFDFVLTSGVMFYTLIYFLPTTGRPEILASIFVYGVIFLWRKKSTIQPLMFNFFLVLALTAILNTQLICFYFTFLFLLIYDCLFTESIWKFIVTNFLRVIGVILFALVFLQCSPNGLVNTINGIHAHINYALTRSDNAIPLLVRFWVTNPYAVGFLFIFLITLVFYFTEMYRKFISIEILKKLMLVLLHLLVVIGFVKYVLYAAPTVYNVTVFIVPILLYNAEHLNVFLNRHPKFWFINIVLALVYVCGIGIMFRWTILLADSYHKGLDFDTCRALIKSKFEADPEIYITNDLWPLTEHVDRLRFLDAASLPIEKPILIQQVNGSMKKINFNEKDVILDHRMKEASVFWGFNLSNNAQNYAFLALYKHAL